MNQGASEHSLSAPLTDLELKVLILIGNDHQDAEIARVLFVGTATVKSHVHHILKKMGAKNRVGAVISAFRQGLLDPTAIKVPDPCSTLTRRERVVASLVAAGLSDAEIAERLVLSRHTVKAHLRNIYYKLGISSRILLALYGLKTDGNHPIGPSP